ncbi:MAG: serine--tRNA ligase [Chloroflexi bacterium]|nr:serine--tRNA ligase [Chloroflexota bacterium]MBU1746259.1 serine--tRNA ligase [Chloroflexota bacterium]
MLDIKLIREHPEVVCRALELRGESPVVIEAIQATDAERRRLLQEVETDKAERNATSKEIAQIKDPARRQELIEAMRALGERIKLLDEQVKAVEGRLEELMLQLPNLLHESTPIGKDESENPVVRTEGEPRQFDFEPLPHWDLGPTLGIIDFERGVKLAGSRFYVLKGAGARLQRALIAWFLATHVDEHGYTEVYLPFVIKRQGLVGAAKLPKFEDTMYHDVEDDVWLIPTAEVSLTNLHADEILDADQLPLHYVAYTACFRREKMSAGRDVRGIKRGHQFDKVEMYKFTTPETSYDELESLTQNAEAMCRALGLAFRRVALCTGDLSFAATKTYDIEVWAPGCGEWLEVSSCSNCEDFQARRANIRYRPEPGARPRFPHTLNGSGLALPRVMIAVMENYQQADGSIVVPEVLRPFMGGLEVIR